MPIEKLPIFAYFNRQRFTQYGSTDSANFYAVSQPDTKNTQALYPALGRKHVESFGQNKLIFNQEPSKIFKSINFMYVIDGTRVIQVDQYYNEIVLGFIPLGSTVWASFLPVGDLVYVMITTGTNIYVITEFPRPTPPTMTLITDPNAPVNPLYIATFGNSFVVSSANTPNYGISKVNLGGSVLDPATAFTVDGAPLFNRASGVIGQMGVLHNQLYIFNDFTTDIWSNIPTQITVAGVTREFPFKQSSSYNWDYGIADPRSLAIDFGRMAWLARNTSGLVSFMASNGQQPEDISTQAVNVLIQNSNDVVDGLSPYITGPVWGFLYQYENTIFYRTAAGPYNGYAQLDIQDSSSSIEYNFATQTWGRAIELNGERSRVQQHTFINNTHLVTVADDPAIYQFAGNIYHNELRNTAVGPQEPNAFNKYPMRYSLTTQQIFNEDYSEFITDYVQIDFVFGDKTFIKSAGPFDNAVFLITEDSDTNCPVYIIAEDQIAGEDVFLIAEDGNTPAFNDDHYYALFKPYIALYSSDDGGVTFQSNDLREFSRRGQYRWLMRWNELGTSRNRVYKLVCVSSAPIVILGAVMSRRRASGGAN